VKPKWHNEILNVWGISILKDYCFRDGYDFADRYEWNSVADVWRRLFPHSNLSKGLLAVALLVVWPG